MESEKINDDHIPAVNTRVTTQLSPTRTPRTPLNNTNTEFIHQIWKRTASPMSRNFQAEHKKSMREISRLNAEERSKTAPSKFFVQSHPVHNYSTHSFNQVERAKQHIRHLIQTV